MQLFVSKIFVTAKFFNLSKLFLLTVCMFLLISGKLFSQNYELVWSDEFDGIALDLSKWECQTGNGSGGWGNNEREYYRAENAVVKNGFLTIVAKNELYNGFNYTSARIRTINKGDWKYGKIEMRAKMPAGKGIWPAFWMMPTDNVYGGWAASGEIDIMELLGHQTNKVYGTIHYGGAWPNNKNSGNSFTLSNSDFNSDFHTFAIIWENGKIQWLVDGNVYLTQTSWYTTGTVFPAPFDQRFHILLNLAVGGNWPGYPDATTTFPQEYIIDYVRVYQKKGTGIADDNVKKNLPSNISLGQNYPNPFNSETIITFEINKQDHVKLTLYDILGRTAMVLVNEDKSPGVYRISVKAGKLNSGVYTYCLNSSNEVLSRKFILIK